METRELPEVARTALWTLRPHADESRRVSPLFIDEKAIEWFEQVKHYEDLDSWYSESFQTAIAIRTRILDDGSKRFIDERQKPLVIELGAGLSTRQYRLGSKEAHWVTLDLPEIIALRHHLDPVFPNGTMIGCSVLDFDWMDRVPGGSPSDTLFIAEGLFIFIQRDDCERLIHKLLNRYPGATLLFDTSGAISQLGEVGTADALGVEVKWLPEDEHVFEDMGLKLINVLPGLYQYPDRINPLMGPIPPTAEMRNVMLLIEAQFPPAEVAQIGDQRLISTTQDAPNLSPIQFCGKEYSAEKTFLLGTHRVCPPDETLAQIQPYFDQVGITRLANITHLDRVGIPAVLAVRPNALVPTSAAGKGLTIETAMASGAMEALETYFAETPAFIPEEIHMPYEELVKVYSAVPVEYLQTAANSLFKPALPERWVLGWDILNQKEVAVPSQLVTLYHDECSYESVNFQMSSNGLASGNHLLEAIAAGLYEVIERDAMSCTQLVWRRLGVHPPRVRLETIDDESIQELLRRLEAAQVRPLLFDLTVDTRVPTYEAVIYDEISRGFGLNQGNGAHLDPAVAMSRALTEAAMSRTVSIAGSRDEIRWHHYELCKKVDNGKLIQSLESSPATVDVRERQTEATNTFEQDIHLVLKRLKRIGIRQVLVVELTPHVGEFSVVRVVVPGLEGYFNYRYYIPGLRARAFLHHHTTGQEYSRGF